LASGLWRWSVLDTDRSSGRRTFGGLCRRTAMRASVDGLRCQAARRGRNLQLRAAHRVRLLPGSTSGRRLSLVSAPGPGSPRAFGAGAPLIAEIAGRF